MRLAFALAISVLPGCTDDESIDDSSSASASQSSGSGSNTNSSDASTASTASTDDSSMATGSVARETWEVDYYPEVWTTFEQELRPRVRLSGSETWAVQGCGIDDFVPELGNRYTIVVEKGAFADPAVDGCGWQARWIETVTQSRVATGTEFELTRLRGEKILSGIAGWSAAGLNFECAELCTEVQAAATTAKDHFYTMTLVIPEGAEDPALLRALVQVP